MERELVILKLEKALSSFGESKASVKFESDDVVKVEIVSNLFKDVILTKRIDMVSKAILDISTTDLIDYNISIIALTEDEISSLNCKGEQILMSNDDVEEIEAAIADPVRPNEYLKAAATRFREKNLN